MRKKAQLDFLNKLYADLVHFECDCGQHTEEEARYLKNAQNSVEVCISSKKNKKTKKNNWPNK